MVLSSFMRRALALAARGRGKTSPNPMVGALVVRDGSIIGEGWHKRAGEPHAEILALQQAGRRARGAELYLTLEPCAHFGKTPPCTKAIIASGIRRVSIAMLDRNPLVFGRGKTALKRAGIEVLIGDGEAEARKLNEAFVFAMERRRPFVIAKFAASLDGKLATARGDARWITNEVSRRFAHRLRDEADGVLVGSGTILTDDPMLTVRLVRTDHQPLRIVLDSRGRIPKSAKIFDTTQAPTLYVTTAEVAERRKHELCGVELLPLPLTDGHLDLTSLIVELHRREVRSLLVEGGPGLLTVFFEANLVNKVYAFLAPLLIGGREAPTAYEGRGVEWLADATRLRDVEIRRLGDNVVVSGYPTV